MNRRCLWSAVTLTILVSLAACKQDPHTWPDETLVDQTVTIPEDGYKLWPYKLAERGPLKAEYSLVAGPSVDVTVFNEEEANQYEAMLKGDHDCAPVHHDPNLSFTPLARTYTSEWFEREPGQYYVIADNADCGEAKTHWDGVKTSATVHVKIIGKKRPASKWPW